MAVPTIKVDVHQTSGKLPYSLVTMVVAISKNYCIETSSPATFKWTASGSGTNEYYLELAAGGNPSSALTSGTIRTARAMQTDATENKYLHMEPGALGSLTVYQCAWGDNDSLGYDTLYVRVGNSGSASNDPARAPNNEEVVIVWDECLTGDSSRWETATIEWWADMTDGDTATALSGFGTGDFTQYMRYMTDPRTGETVDILGTVPTAYVGSQMQGPMVQVPLPAGTYAWKCRVTNSSGEQTTTDIAFTVNAESRTLYTVNSAGGADYTSITAAWTAGRTLVEVEAGHTETIATTTNTPAASLTYFNGTGTKPKITRDSNSRFQIAGAGFGMVGIDQASADTNTRAAWDFVPTGSGCADSYTAGCNVVSGAGIFGTGWEFSSTSASQANVTKRIAVINCETEVAVTSYVVQTENDEHASYACGLYGCTIGPSTNESTSRTTGMITMFVTLYSDLHEDSKDVIRQSYGEGFWVWHCVTDGSNRIGETGNNFHKARRARWEANKILRTATTSGLPSMSLQAGTEDYCLVNNVLVSSVAENGFGLSSNPGLTTTPFAGYANCRRIIMYHNTLELTAGTPVAIHGGGTIDDTWINGCEAQGNLVAKPSAYSAIVNTPNTKLTLADNQEIVGSLDADFQMADADTITTLPGAYYDYNGFVRGATSLQGAAIDDPTPAEPGPSDMTKGVRSTRGVRSIRGIR